MNSYYHTPQLVTKETQLTIIKSVDVLDETVVDFVVEPYLTNYQTVNFIYSFKLLPRNASIELYNYLQHFLPVRVFVFIRRMMVLFSVILHILFLFLFFVVYAPIAFVVVLLINVVKSLLEFIVCSPNPIEFKQNFRSMWYFAICSSYTDALFGDDTDDVKLKFNRSRCFDCCECVHLLGPTRDPEWYYGQKYENFQDTNYRLASTDQLREIEIKTGVQTFANSV